MSSIVNSVIVNALQAYLAQIGFRYLLHFCKHHGGNFLRKECLRLTLVLHFHLWLPTIINHLEGPVLHI